MKLIKLNLINFKNYAQQLLNFEGQVHCFLGKNGSGKTNLIEAIHYLSLTKGAIQTRDSFNVRHGQNFFTIDGIFENSGNQATINCSFMLPGKKKISENGSEYQRYSEHLGKYPIVLIAPHNMELILEGADYRRKYFDSILSQIDKIYLNSLITYNFNLKQRNSLLKMYLEGGSIDNDLLATYDEKLVALGSVIFLKRKDFVREFESLLNKRYSFLSNNKENVGLQYFSSLHDNDFGYELKSSRKRDLEIGRTSVGIHKDDFLFFLQDFELKQIGSQGQQKTFLIALKLAEFDFWLKKHEIKPIMLMDDIFDKLDDDRINQLLELIKQKSFDQVFITESRSERSLESLKTSGVEPQNFTISKGIIQS